MQYELLEEVHQSSKILMSTIAENHQHVSDCLHALRFLLRTGDTTGTPNPLVDGIERVLQHQEDLKRVATSYHVAVGNVVKAEKMT